MSRLRDWFEEKVLDLKLVKTNIKNAYETGKLEGSQSIVVSEKNNEILSLIQKIEDLRSDITAIDITNMKKAVEVEMSRLLSVVDMSKIVSKDLKTKQVYIGGILVDNARLVNLISEAEALGKFDLWGLLNETPKEIAQRTMFISSESLDDMKKGKSMLYLLSQQNNIVNLFKELGNK